MSNTGGAVTRLFLVRHGRVHNPRDLAYGHLPRFALDATGRAQAARAGDWLAAHDIAALYHSPLLRARQTAGIILAALGAIPRHQARDLRESELARVWQGLAWPEIVTRHRDLYAAFASTPSVITTGETMAAMAARMAGVCRRAARRYPGRAVALVSHRDPILALRLAVAGRSHDELNRTACAPGSITEFRGDGGTLDFAGYSEPEACGCAGR